MSHRNGKTRSLVAVALTAGLAIAGFAAASVGMSPSTATAYCTPHANAPYYDNGTVKAWGYVDCSREYVEGGWTAQGALKRNGTVVDRDGCFAVGPTRCHVTPAAPNRSGNQRWCHEVSGGHPGPTYDTRCENKGF